MSEASEMRVLGLAQSAAIDFLRHEAGFAQVTTLGIGGFPVSRSTTAFFNDDWSVDLIQRRQHSRLKQWQRDPRTLVTSVGTPAPNATNERPRVFDIGQLPSRAVFIRGSAQIMESEWTVERYERETRSQRNRGFQRAPRLTPEQVRDELVGVHIRPFRIRIEGFGTAAQSFDWAIEN